MVRKISLLILFVFQLLPFGAQTASAVLEEQPAHMIKNVIEVLQDGTLVLEGGGKVVLSGLRWWTLFGSDNNTTASPKELLEKYTDQGPLKFYLDAAPKDRYDRMHAMVVTGNGTFVQQDLLQQGMAMFWPNSEQNAVLRDAENKAKKDKLGRWGWSSGVVMCHNWSGFWNEGMAIVKGRVKEVKEFDNSIYMNFGEVWWQDFTIKVDNRWAEQNSFKAYSFVGKPVEVRGWLYWQGGPQILLEHKEQIAPLGEEWGNVAWSVCPPLDGAS